MLSISRIIQLYACTLCSLYHCYTRFIIMFHCYQYKMLATVHKKLLSCLNESNNLQTERKKKIFTYQILIDMLTLENIEKILRRS